MAHHFIGDGAGAAGRFGNPGFGGVGEVGLGAGQHAHQVLLVGAQALGGRLQLLHRGLGELQRVGAAQHFAAGVERAFDRLARQPEVHLAQLAQHVERFLGKFVHEVDLRFEMRAQGGVVA